ncbi:small integral membrane protein 35 isoform X6 [Gallus gallus]|uniref:small integral membrane protein 35 isoform X6 n=1 Tax=Gallus gallus TaxID=9031 RepID=UPI000739CAD0|nr:small integral membrane protein 35 isoform X6 [Gallus gallus]|eukprot:XP_015153749.1 small integral membrane protein 35 isoform X5 [Gallus gallus]
MLCCSPAVCCVPSGQGLISVFGFILGIGLALLILIISGYAVFLCYQQGWCWCRPDFIFNLYHGRLRSVAVELAPPFSISASVSQAGNGYVRFHEQGL